MWATLKTRSARRWPTSQRTQRSQVEMRLPKPLRKARWTNIHTTQAGNPLRRIPRTLQMALKRPMAATLPRSRYVNGRSSVSPLEPADDGVGGVQAALHGHLAHAGQPVQADHVADGEDLGVTGDRQVGQHRDAPGPVDLGARGVGQRLGQR